MKYLLKATILKKIQPLPGDRILLAFDYDGTLAPIVRISDQARLSPSTLKLLRKLNAIATIAIISGRGVADLRSRLGFKPQFLVGNHGMEGLEKNQRKRRNFRSVCLRWQASLKNVLEVAKDQVKGVWIENKTYSLTIHYREAVQKKLALFYIQKAIRSLRPVPRVILGKSVFNLVSPEALDKGRAMQQLIRKVRADFSFYIGDDATDEDVFRLPRSSLVTVRIGAKASSKARYFLRRRSEINRLLKHLIRVCEESAKNGRA